jgi:hypothetical protein
MLAKNYPPHSFPAVIEACDRRIFHVWDFMRAAQLLFDEGYAGKVCDLPRTAPEKVLEGRMNTLLGFWVSLGPVDFITATFMEMSIADAQIKVLKSAAYVTDGVIQWPHLEFNGSTWWLPSVLPDVEERTSQLVTKPVFSGLLSTKVWAVGSGLYWNGWPQWKRQV